MSLGKFLPKRRQLGMGKYILVIKNTWNEILTYRLNFVMWRARTILQFLTIYFLWLAIIPAQGEVFGWSQSLILTYILGGALLTSIIFSTRTHEIGDNIVKGDLSIFLVKPLNYFAYWFSRDVGDKLMNISFATVELYFLFLILKPPIFIQTDPFYLVAALSAMILALLLYFLLGCLLGLLGFWSSEVWAPRFIFFILITFFAGGLFPLDILPESLFRIFEYFPFTYLLYFPLKVYLGGLDYFHIFKGGVFAFFWIIILSFLVYLIWQKGLKNYTAYGR